MKADRTKIGSGITIYRRWKTWWVDLRVDGRRIKRSLDTQDKTEAIRLALNLVSEKRYPSVENLAQALDRYLVEHGEIHLKPNVKKRNQQVISVFVAQVGPTKRPAQVTRNDVLAFQRTRAAAVAPDTANGDLGYVKAFLNWCRAEGLLDHDPCFKVKRIRINRKTRVTLTLQEFERVLTAVSANHFLHDFAIVAANTGMRPNEILHVRGCDLKDRLLSIAAWIEHRELADGSTKHIPWQPKDFEDRTIELNDEALAVLSRRKLAKGNDQLPLFAGRGGVVRDWKNVYHELKKCLTHDVKKDPPEKKALVEGLGWVGLYEFRHFFGTEASKGWPVAKLREYMGHADISTTMRATNRPRLRCQARKTVPNPPWPICLTRTKLPN